MVLTTSNESDPSGTTYVRYFLYDDPDWSWENVVYATVDDYDLAVLRLGRKADHSLADASAVTRLSFYVQRTLAPQSVPVSAIKLHA